MFIYKMYLISAEGYRNADVEFLTIKTTSEIWVSMNKKLKKTPLSKIPLLNVLFWMQLSIKINEIANNV